MTAETSVVELWWDGDWHTVTADVVQVETNRASRRTRGAVREWSPGTFRVVLNSAETRYDPVALPELRPGAPIRISFDGGAGAQRVFTGEVEDIQPGFDDMPHWATIELTGVDAMGAISRVNIPEESPAVGLGDTIADRLDRVLDEIGWPNDRRAIPPGGVELAATSFGVGAWAAMEAAVAADPGDLWIDPEGRVAFRSLVDTLAGATSPEVTFGLSVGGFPMQRIAPVYDRQLVLNRITYARTGEAESTIEDEGSRDAYTGGVFWSETFTDLPHRYQADADDWAQLTLLSQATPELWVSEVVLQMRGNPALQQAVLGLDIADIIRIVVPAPRGNGDPIDRIALVRGVKWAKTRGRNWTCTLTLASASRYNFLRYDDPDATLDVAGFAPAIDGWFTGGRYDAEATALLDDDTGDILLDDDTDLPLLVESANELVPVSDWQMLADQCVGVYDDLAQLGAEFPAPHVGAFVYRKDRGFVFFNGTTWLRPVG